MLFAVARPAHLRSPFLPGELTFYVDQTGGNRSLPRLFVRCSNCYAARSCPEELRLRSCGTPPSSSSRNLGTNTPENAPRTLNHTTNQSAVATSASGILVGALKM